MDFFAQKQFRPNKRRHLKIGKLFEPGGNIVESPGPGEVESVQVDQLTVSPVNHLLSRRKFNRIQLLSSKLW